jgi:hypothetical protein
MALWSFGHLLMVNDKRRDDQMGVKTPADVVPDLGLARPLAEGLPHDELIK